MATSASKTVIEAVRGRMELLGMTQAELAKHAGTTQATVSRWLSGRHVPDIDDLAALAEALRISPEKLLKGRTR